MDWDEELKRQAAISALLAPPEDGQAPPLDTQTDEQVTAQPDVLQPDKSDWHKLANQVFPTIAEDQGASDKYPTIASDQPSGPPKNYPDISPPAPEPADVKTDEDTGTRYVQDPLEGKIPHAELASEADKEAFKPSDVTLPEETAIGTGAPIEVRRGERVLEMPKPTPESAAPPLPPGIIPGSQNAILNPAAGVTPSTPVVSDKYPAQIVTPDEAAGKTGVVNTQANVIDPRVPTPAPVAPSQVTGGQGFFGGDLTQGPPGTKPNGTEDEPYWPKTDKDVALLPPGANYIDPKDQSQKVTPGAPVPAPAAAPAAATPTSTDQTAIQPSLDDWNKLADSIFPSADSKAKTAAPAGPVSMVNPDGTPIPDRIQAVDGNDPAAIIIHHTGDHHTAPQTKAVLDQRGLGVELTVDRDGNIVQIGAPGAQNIKTGWGPKGTGLNNSNIVGIEVAANDDGDVLPVQIQAVKNYLAARGYGNIPVYGHGEVNPGHKEADEGMTVVNSIRADRASGAAAPTGEPGTTPIETLVKLDQSGINVTHFGYEKPGEEGYDADSASGNGKYVKNLIPGYDVALNSAGAALVGNPQPGETFQFAGREWRYGDAASEKLKDPRFDIFDPTGNALSGSVQLGRVGAAEPKEQSLDDLAKDWIKVSPEDQAAADKQGQDSRTKILTDIQNKAPNLPAFMQALENPIQGISDADRNAKAAEIKKQLTAYAQDYYKEPDPDKAYARVMAAAATPAGTAAGELVSKLGPNFMHAWLSLKQQTDSPIQTRLIDFINQTHPDASPEARTALISQVMAKTGKDRVDFVNAMYDHAQAENPDSVKNINLLALHDAIDVSAQPGMEAKMDQYHTWVQGMVAQNLKDLREDPSLEHTALGSVADATPAMIKNIAEVAIPYIGQSAMLSEVYTDTLDGLRREHPELSEDQLKAMAASKSLPQAVLQELVNAGTMGVGGSALKGVQNPIARIISSGIAHGVVGGTAGTAQQALSNVMTGRPAGEGLQEAGTTAFIQSFLGGAWGGRHGEAEAPPPGEPTPAVPLTENTKLPRNVVGGGAETAVPSEPTPILTPNRAVRTSDVLGTEPGDQHVVSTTDVLGHQEDYTPQEPLPWFKQGVTPAEQHDPLVIRGAERTSFTPQELSDIVNRLPSNATPAEVARVLANVQSPTGVHLGEESTGEVQRAQAAQEQPGPVQFWKSDRQRTLAEQAWIKANAGEPVGNAIAKAKAAASLGGAPAAPTTPQAKPSAEKQMRPGPPPPVNGNISGEDPHIVRESNKTTVNGVANRYVAERVAGGELPQTDPNIGVTTEELLARGAKMGPEEINKHVSDLMDGKVNNPRDMAAAVRAKERELTQRSRQLGILSEENPSDASAKLDADNALAKLHDFHSEGGPIKKMKELFNHLGVGLQGDLQYDLSSENGLKEKFFQESKGKKAPPQADPVIKETAARVRRAYSEDYQAKKRVSAEVDKWLGKKMSDSQIEETRQAALKKMNQVPC